MYVSFNCSKCSQELEVEQDMIGEQIECPTCSEVLTIPSDKPSPPSGPNSSPPASKPEELTTASPKEKHSLSVPMREGPGEILVKKKAADEPSAPTPPAKHFRIKCIKRINCVEVGHDLFEEKVAKAIDKIGDENIVSLHPIGYGYMDTTGNMLPDYGVMIVYKG